MKRLILITAALSALVAASASRGAPEERRRQPGQCDSLAATAANVQTRTLTCDGQTIEITLGHYSGTATSTTTSSTARSTCS